MSSKMVNILLCVFLLIFTITGVISADKNNLNEFKNRDKTRFVKIDTNLVRLYDLYKSGGKSGAVKFARDTNLNMDGDSGILLTVTLNADSTAEELENFRLKVESLGGEIFGYTNLVKEIRLPLQAVRELAEQPGVNFIYPTLESARFDITSEGVAATGADDFIALPPYKNKEERIKVAIIDSGFGGYEDLLGVELPEDTHLLTFPNGITWNSHVHGTGCAEVVYDMAPEADIYLLATSGIAGRYQAVDYCIENGIDVISMSVGSWGSDACDGTGPHCDLMRRAYENGIIWATAAGNMQDLNWYGNPIDSDDDGWMEFTAGDEIYEFDGAGGLGYSIFFDWDDWGTWNGQAYSGTSLDYDIYLLKWNGTDWEEVNSSVNVQNGDDTPFEYMGGFFPETGKYGLSIKRSGGSGSATLRLQYYRYVTFGMSNMEYLKTDQSLWGGATCEHTITVGAFYVTGGDLARYSSLGPTRDGRTKPDIASPTHVSCVSYGTLGFTGTSAATPHVAGAVALLLSRLPMVTYEDVFAFFTARAVEAGAPGKDNSWGVGKLKLD